METMRARTNGSLACDIEVIERNVVDLKILFPGSNDSMRKRLYSDRICVG